VPRWTFEPGHTAAEFRARHMMVTWVRGHFKDVHGSLEFDPDDPLRATFEGTIDATRVWTGEPVRDAHLRSPDFLDVEKHPTITFEGRLVEQVGPTEFKGTARLSLRGVEREVPLAVVYLGEWTTPYWVGDENRGTMTRNGFVVKTQIDRHAFDVSWNDRLDRGGVVVSNDVYVTIDVEGILDEDLSAVEAGRRGVTSAAPWAFPHAGPREREQGA
jgi:polyisoprenoid-binding protein YceI